MNIKEIKEMIQLMNENGLSEFEMEKDGLKIKLKKTDSGSFEPMMIQAAPRPSPASRNAAQEAPQEAIKPVPAAKNFIKSPMVGTYYSAPAPDAQPFVQVGMQIEVGQVVCIMEAMKLMNEIKSEVRGKIAEILVNNGDPVEFGQPLFRLE